MSRTTASPRRAVSHARGRKRSAREIDDAMRRIVSSDEPAVVLAGLARSSTPCFSDACAVELSEGTDTPFRVCFPMPEEAGFPADAGSARARVGPPPAAMKSIITRFQAGSEHGYPSYAGMVVHAWAERDPTGDDAVIARLLVDRALAIVRHERLAQAAARADSRAAKLAIDLIASRVEGEATGILMAKHQVTRGEAMRLLRQASRTSQRELQEIAAGVVCAGELGSLSHSQAGRPARPGHLHVAPTARP